MKKRSLIVAVVVLIYDQLIKYIVNKSLYYGSLKPVIPRIFYITKVYNDGAAWSTMSGKRFVLVGIAIISFVILWVYQNSFKTTKRNEIAFGFIYGGLIGNLIDRVVHGYVIDFFKINIFNYEMPIFNIADVAIVVGFILLIYAIIKGEDKNEVSSKRK